MTPKQHFIELFKPWSSTGFFGAFLHKVVSKLKHLFEFPVAYEDETGFHLGPEPDDERSGSGQ